MRAAVVEDPHGGWVKVAYWGPPPPFVAGKHLCGDTRGSRHSIAMQRPSVMENDKSKRKEINTTVIYEEINTTVIFEDEDL